MASSTTTTAKQAPPPGLNEAAVQHQLDAIDADLLDAGFVSAILSRAKSQDRSQRVQDRRAAAQAALAAASGTFRAALC